jgi:hypothetical protein
MFQNHGPQMVWQSALSTANHTSAAAASEALSRTLPDARVSLSKTRYLLQSLLLRAESDTVRRNMTALFVASFAAFRSSVRSRFELEVAILTLRHQLAVLRRQVPRRPRLGRADRCLWVASSSLGPGWQTRPMTSQPSSYHGYRFPPGIISHAVLLYHRFCLSFRGTEDLLAQRGITVSYEAIRQST